MTGETRDAIDLFSDRNYKDPYGKLYNIEQECRNAAYREAKKNRIENRAKEREIKAKNKRRKILNRVKIITAVGLTSVGLISGAQQIANMIGKEKFEEEENSKIAIEMANKMDKTLAMALEFDDYQMMEMSAFQEAVTKYNAFEQDEDYKKNNIAEYAKVCEQILNNKDFISKEYTKLIQEKVTEAYKINDMSSVSTKYYENSRDPNAASIVIKKDDETIWISEHPFLPNKEKQMDAILAKTVKIARTTKDIDNIVNLDNTENVEEVIRAYGSMNKFAETHLSVDENNNIVVSQEKENKDNGEKNESVETQKVQEEQEEER